LNATARRCGVTAARAGSAPTLLIIAQGAPQRRGLCGRHRQYRCLRRVTCIVDGSVALQQARDVSAHAKLYRRSRLQLPDDQLQICLVDGKATQIRHQRSRGICIHAAADCARTRCRIGKLARCPKAGADNARSVSSHASAICNAVRGVHAKPICGEGDLGTPHEGRTGRDFGIADVRHTSHVAKAVVKKRSRKHGKYPL
jgi:hypothetical protein